MTAARSDEKDHYATLGVAPDATLKEITSAYRDLALRHHPDRNLDDPSAGDRFGQISAAYHELSSDVRRQHHDRTRHGEFLAPVGRRKVRRLPRWPAVVVVGLAAVLVGGWSVIGSWGPATSDVPIPRVVSPRAGTTISYVFLPVACGPGGWSGLITNTDSVSFSGDVTAVATRDGKVIARGREPVVGLDPGRSIQLQFSWNAADVASCSVESVTQQ